MPEAVDMGLSVKWASFNMGASRPEEVGAYYRWGATKPTGVISLKGGMLASNKSFSFQDTAKAVWGKGWRMPTWKEFQELINKCEWEWTRRQGVEGFLIYSPITGNSIFLPVTAALYEMDQIVMTNGGFYWSSTPHPDSPVMGMCLYFFKGDEGFLERHIEEDVCVDSYCIRPVHP